MEKEKKKKKKKEDGASHEALLAELDVHKMEFSALRSEILYWLDAEKQHLNLSIVAIGATIGFIPLIIEEKLFILLLLVPFVFHVLLYEMLNALKALMSISNYLLEILIPRVTELLQELGDKRTAIQVLGWERYAAHRAQKMVSMFLAALTPSKAWVPILSVAGMLIAYILLVQANGVLPTAIELWLIAINLLLLIMASIRNSMLVRGSTGLKQSS